MSLDQLGQIEITIATGNSTPLDKAPATASVVTAAEIEAMGARNLEEVLEGIPGVHIARSTTARMDSVYSIRGIHTGFNPHVLLLMNGVPVQFSYSGGRPVLFRLPIASIHRVEVIRGPGSAIYGADAYSGVINVITKDASTLGHSEFGARAGSFDMRDLWASTSTVLGNWDASFSIAYQTSDGDKDRRVQSDLQSALDSALGTTASNAPGPLSTRYEILDTHISFGDPNWKINLWSWHAANSGLGAGIAEALDSKGTNDDDLFLGDISYSTGDWADEWENNIRLSYLYYDTQSTYNVLPEGTVLPIGSDGNIDFATPIGIVQFPDGYLGNPGGISEDSQFDFVSIYSGFDSHRLRVAFGLRYQSLNTNETKNFGPNVIDGTEQVVDGTLTNVSNSPFVFAPDKSRTIRYLSVQDEWHITSDWDLTTGVRYDKYSDFGETINPRVALVWETNKSLTTKFLYGSAFRAPSFGELFNQNNPVNLGRSDLDPEKIDTYEIALHFNLSEQLQTSLNLFHYQARDMIEYVPDEGATTQTAQNARDQDGHGFEWVANWKPQKKWQVNFNYSWQKAEDAKSDTNIADTPNQQFTVSTFWEFQPNWFIHSKLNWVGDRKRNSIDPREEIDDYTLIDLTLRGKEILPGVDFALAVRNLTDEDAREPSNGTIPDDYPLEGRSVWAELSYTFK